MALTQLNDDSKRWIEENFGDVQQWIKDTIESVLYGLKNKPTDESANEND